MNLDFRIFYWIRKWELYFPIYLFHFNICFQLFYFSIIEKWHYDRKIEKMVNCQQEGWSTHFYHEFNIQTHKYLKSRIHSISCIWIFVKLNPWKVYSCNINVCLMTRVLLGLFFVSFNLKKIWSCGASFGFDGVLENSNWRLIRSNFPSHIALLEKNCCLKLEWRFTFKWKEGV